jgi:hypothetical protein
MEITENLDDPSDVIPTPLPPPEPPLPQPLQVVPLIYNDSIDTSTIQNIMLIDSEMGDSQTFYDNVNSNTFPILYSYNSRKEDLYNVLKQKFTSSIQRISLVFHDKGPNLTASFLDNQLLFQDADLDENQTEFTENVSFLIKCIQEFHVHNIDFLACNTLQYDNWKKYYNVLSSKTTVVVGASNNNTGNLNYGGDWVMENTSEDIQNMYFNESISNYASTLASTITVNGATESIYLKMNVSVIAYYVGSSPTGGSYTNIASWPVTIVNSTPTSSTRLNVVFTQNLTIASSNSQYFIAGSSYITFNGANYNMNITNILTYPGLIQNGTSTTNGFSNITVQNITTNVTGTSSLAYEAGWICATYFSNGATGNTITNCSNSGAITSDYAGGIAGSYVAVGNGSITFTNCSNSGAITSDYAGGIAGLGAGYTGSATFTNCSNTGEINAQYAGGIAGYGAGYTGSVTFTNCSNTGTITGLRAGGITGAYAGENGSATFTNCSNTGAITGSRAGGIAGVAAGYNNGSATFTNCSNSSAISGTSAGGIAGVAAGYTGSATFTNCSNTGTISGTSAGGIAGAAAGFTGSATLTNCSNTGTISGSGAGGIAGGYSCQVAGSATLTNCSNTGAINGTNAGGIAGQSAGLIDGSLTFTNCSNSGAITSDYVGGIAGAYFGVNTNNLCQIINCYSTGIISGSQAGGITGAEVGYSDNATYTPQVNITNCYSLGTIASTAGGICGGTKGYTFATTPVITITNCYSYGEYTDPDSGIVSVEYPKPVTISHCYAADGIWSDTAPNNQLTGKPTITINPGVTWASPGINIPYILSTQLRKQLY